MKVLIIGLGSIAKKHISALRELGNFQISALRSSKSSKKIQDVQNIYDWEDLSLYDFFIISNPTYNHFESINEIFKYKKPIFIEKPLFNSIGSRENDLVNRVISADISTYVGCNLRFLDCLMKIRSILPEIKVNEINIYAGSYLPDWRPNVDYRTSYSANASMGGGVHIDLIHELDYLYWLAGEPSETKKTLKSNSTLKINSIDYANYLWEYDDYCANVTLNYFRKHPKRSLEIVTHNDIYSVDLLQNKILKNNREYFSSEQGILDTYKLQMKHFLARINADGKFENDIQTAYNILKLCLKG